jgi:TM2 domain-containing membrane protein YozV
MSQQWGDPPPPSNPSSGPSGYNPGGTPPPYSPPPAPYGYPPQQNWQAMGADKKIAAGICGILVGSFGVHKFILGYTTEGVIMLCIWFAAFFIAMITCGIGSVLVLIPYVIGLVEGIMYLTKSDEEFVRTYIHNKKPWF